jgi:hypothetical protein
VGVGAVTSNLRRGAASATGVDTVPAQLEQACSRLKGRSRPLELVLSEFTNHRSRARMSSSSIG